MIGRFGGDGTAGTVGVAFIGIAQGLGIPLSHAAGAIVAGNPAIHQALLERMAAVPPR